MSLTTYYDFDIPVDGEAGGPGTWGAKLSDIASKVEAAAETVPVRSAGVTGSAADPANLTALLSKLAAVPSKRFNLLFGDGTYPYFSNLTLPWNVVGLTGTGRSLIQNAAVNGGRLMTVQGSRFSLRGMTIDHMRDQQTSGQVSGWAAVVFAKPTATTGGGSLAGGLTLSANASIGATSLSVTSGSPGGVPVLPGDYINVREGSTYDVLRVRNSHTAGATTVPLSAPLPHGYTTGASVTLCMTGCLIDDCEIFGQVAGQSMVHWVTRDSSIRDAPDTCWGIFDGGSASCWLSNCDIDSPGHWLVFIDTITAGYPPTRGMHLSHNNLRFVGGAADYSSLGDTATVGAIDAIGLEGCQDVDIDGNRIDLTLAGIRGVRIEWNCLRTRVSGGRIVGGVRSNTLGVANVTVGQTGNPDNDTSVEGVRIEGTDYGVDFGGTVSGRARNLDIRSCLTAGVNSICVPSATTTRRYLVTGCDISGAQVGLRFTGPPAAPSGSYVKRGANNIWGQSFTPEVVDNGFTAT